MNTYRCGYVTLEIDRTRQFWPICPDFCPEQPELTTNRPCGCVFLDHFEVQRTLLCQSGHYLFPILVTNPFLCSHGLSTSEKVM